MMATNEQVDEWQREIFEEIYAKVVRPFVLSVIKEMNLQIPAENSRYLVSRNKREGRYSGKKEGKHTHSGWKLLGFGGGDGVTISIARYIPLHMKKRFKC